MTVKIVKNYLIPPMVLNDAYRTENGTVASTQDGLFYMADEPGRIRWPDHLVLTREEIMALSNEMLANVARDNFTQDDCIEIGYRLLLDEFIKRPRPVWTADRLG